MKRQSFHERLEEMPNVLGKTWSEIRKDLGMKEDALRQVRIVDNLYTTTMQRIGFGLGLIPVVLYRTEDEKSEGSKDFLHGEHEANYIGRAFANRRTMKKMQPKDVAKKCGILPYSQILRYEEGAGMMTNRLELICSALELIPQYLVKPLPRQSEK
ncbi:MAG TPA: helix-turn-helix transcriptional regulator [Candidatus Nanoarchaeia archaeon]|nr:helix-turn-helix transcriptional regulator [Candidatus Nanoarchaeia archaeon]